MSRVRFAPSPKIRHAYDPGMGKLTSPEGNSEAIRPGIGEATPTILGQRREINSLLSRLEEVTKSEAEARESEQSFRWLVEHSRDVLFRGNYRTLQYDYLSPNIQLIAGGFTPEEIVAMGQSGFATPRTRSNSGASWANCSREAAVPTTSNIDSWGKTASSAG